MHDVKSTCDYKDLPLRGTHWYINTWRKRSIMLIIILCYFEIFTSSQGSMRTFSNHYFRCKTVSIKFRKTLQEKRLPISKFSQDNRQNNFLNFLTSENIIPGISLEYFWNRHSWNVPRIFWKHYFMITGICQKINIWYYQIVHKNYFSNEKFLKNIFLQNFP